MDHTHPHAFPKAASILAAVSATLLLVGACGSSQSEIDSAVNATRTADQQASNAIALAVAATLDAAPSPTSAPPPGPTARSVPATTTVASCPESMSDLEAIAMTYLEGDRFMVALEKGQPFLEQEYILLVNGAEYECAPIAGQGPNRVYCIGRPVPPVGEAAVQMRSASSSCAFEIPFSTISVPPRPVVPTSAGGYP